MSQCVHFVKQISGTKVVLQFELFEMQQVLAAKSGCTTATKICSVLRLYISAILTKPGSTSELTIDSDDKAVCCALCTQVLGEAAAMDAKYDRGEPITPLCGLPLAVKDTIDVEGYRTTAATPGLGRESLNLSLLS